MHPKFNPRKLSVLNFAKTQASLEGVEPLAQFDRLHEFQQPGAQACEVHFQAQGEMRATSAGASTPWLVLSASTRLTMVCQRCLGPVEQALAVDRWFRFVETEALAEAQDDEAEEDLLVTSRQFNLAGLIEDELLMALPLVPRHDTCPAGLKMAVADPGFDAQEPEKVHPFAALAKLRRGSPD